MNPAWFGEMIEGRINSNRCVNNLDNNLRSTFKRVIGWYEAKDKGSLPFLRITEMEAWVSVSGRPPELNDSLIISIRKGANLRQNFL